MIFVLAAIPDVSSELHNLLDPEILKLRYDIDAMLSEGESQYLLDTGQQMLHLDSDKISNSLLSYMLKPIQRLLYNPIVVTATHEINDGFISDLVEQYFDTEVMFAEMELSLGDDVFRVSYADTDGNTETHLERMEVLFTDNVSVDMDEIFRKFYAVLRDELKYMLTKNIHIFVQHVTGK